MGNIPLPPKSQARSASGFAQASPNLGTDSAVAMQNLGRVGAQSAGLLKQFYEKKQAVHNKAVIAEYELDLDAKRAAVDEFIRENQGSPEKIREFASRRMEEIGKIDMSAADEETTVALKQRQEMDAQVFGNEVNKTAMKLEIDRANTTILTRAQAQIDRGDVAGAIQIANDANIPDSERINWITENVRKKQYSDVEYELDNLTTVSEYDAFMEGIMAQDEETGLFRSYTVSVDISDKNEDPEMLELAGISKDQRDYFRALANKRKTKLLIEQKKHEDEIMRLAKRGDPNALDLLDRRKGREDADGLRSQVEQGLEKRVRAALKEADRTESLEELRRQAKTGDTKEDYQEVEAAMAAAVFDPESFDFKDVIKSIDKADYGEAVKLEQYSKALEIQAARDLTTPAEEEGFVSKYFKYNPATWIHHTIYRQFKDDGEIKPQESKLLSRAHTELKAAIDAGVLTSQITGDEDGDLPSYLNDIQKNLAELYSEDEDPTPEDIDQFMQKFIVPLQEKIIEAQYGTE